MEQKNKKLLNEVITSRLEAAKENIPGTKESDAIMKEALEAIDRSIEITKHEEESEARIESNQIKQKDEKKNRVIKFVEIACLSVGVEIVRQAFMRKNMKDVCEFEKTNTFVSSAGKYFSRSIFNRK